MKKLLLGTTLLLSLLSFGQNKVNPEKFANTITQSDLRATLTKVASKEMEGRETASPGQRRAAAYIEQRFRDLGLKPGNNGSYQMKYPVYQDSVLSETLQIDDQKFSYPQDVSANIAADVSGTYNFPQIVFVGQGRQDSLHDDYKNLDVKGKAVLVLSSTAANRGARAENARKVSIAGKNGAAVVLMSNPGGKFFASSPVGGMRLNNSNRAAGTQLFNISDAVAKFILGGDFNNVMNVAPKVYNTRVNLDFKKNSNTLESSNVLGVLEGTDKKDEFLFLTAHYDHLGKRDTVIYYGADDDGSGTTSVIEMAKAFTEAARKGYRPRRTIVFMTVSGEEKGLLGSEYYSEHPIFPIDKTTADLNTDMVGRVGSDFIGSKDSLNYVYVIGDDKLSSDLPDLTARNNINHLILDKRYNDLKDPNRFYYRSDHFNFANKGIPVVFYFDGVHKDYHQPSDTVDKINFDLMEKRVRYIFLTAWDVSNMDRMIKRDIPLPTLER